MATIQRNKRSRGQVRSGSGTANKNSRPLFILRMRVLLALGVIGLLDWGAQVVWKRVEPVVIHREPYLLTASQTTMSPQPEWIVSDVRSEIIQNSGLDKGISILDDSFMTVVQNAFSLHPWIASVEKVAKQYPAGVHVEVTFRRPVAVVEMASEEGMLLVPLDEQAVVLPIDDVPEIRKRYMPRIQNIVDRPPVGQEWDNPRVHGAVALASRLADVWEELHLVDILPSTRPEIQEQNRFFVYDLMTRGGTRIVWGAAPGISPAGEADFATKLQRLRQCVNEHGPLNTVQSPAVVDVRSNLTVTPRTVKKPMGERTVKRDSPDASKTSTVK